MLAASWTAEKAAREELARQYETAAFHLVSDPEMIAAACGSEYPPELICRSYALALDDGMAAALAALVCENATALGIRYLQPILSSADEADA